MGAVPLLFACGEPVPLIQNTFVLLFHRGEKSLVLERAEQARIQVSADVLINVGELLEDVLRALQRRLEVLRRLRLEIVVGDVEDFRTADFQLLRQYLLGALLVRDRDIIAFDAGLEEAREDVAARRYIVMAHDDAGEQPRNLVGNEVDQHVEALFTGERGERLVDRRRLDLTRLQRFDAAHAAAIFLDGDVVALQAKLLQGERHRRIAFRAECADADDAAFQVGRSLDAGRGKEREADDVREPADDAQVAAGLIDPDYRR